MPDGHRHKEGHAQKASASLRPTWRGSLVCEGVLHECCSGILHACSGLSRCSMCAYDQRSNASWLSRCFDIWGNKLIWSLCILTCLLFRGCTHLHNYPLLQSEQIGRWVREENGLQDKNRREGETVMRAGTWGMLDAGTDRLREGGGIIESGRILKY